ncbi:MAG TPA: NHL repeat-containing protein [Edaphobacter sp.]|nr:NHL repeat-containing protein [Edaphobacter sp.]
MITDANGGFTITGDYTCPSSSSQLYIVATGGNPGLPPGTNNAAIALMAALGPCSLHGGQYTLDPNGFISINEVTTVASVYALAAFMGGDATHVGASGTNVIGLANSFGLVNNLVNTTTGAALMVTPAGNGTPPQAAINTLGNIVASCVNSDGTGTPCSALFAAATPSGGATPTDTIQGIFNVARNPANHVSALYALSGATPPFQPTLSVAPNDWVMAVTYTNAGPAPLGPMAIDASGNAWFTNNASGGPYSVSELSSNGAVLSGSNGYTGGGLSAPAGIAIDPGGNVWVPSTGNVVKFSSSGTVLSGANGYTGGGLNTPAAIALDGQGNAWVSDTTSKSVIKLDNSGNILSGASGFSPGTGTSPQGLGVDVAGNVWMGTESGVAVVELSNSGTVISGSGYAVTDFGPVGVAFDGSGNAWTNTGLGHPVSSQLGLNNVAKLSSSGVELSPSGGYANCVSPGIVGGLNILCLYWAPNAFALDGAGNVWSEVVWETKVNGRVPNPMISGAVAEMSNTGTILSGATGYTGTTTLGLLSPIGQSGPGTVPQSVAIDGGGNVWVLLSDGSVVEFVGAATPVVTPFSLGVRNGTLGSRP